MNRRWTLLGGLLALLLVVPAIRAETPVTGAQALDRLKAGNTRFAAEDHRSFNRHGEAFDVGETFAGVDFDSGLSVVEELRELVPEGATMGQFALRWVLMEDAVSTVIAGARTPMQATQNASASELPALDSDAMERVSRLYRERVAPQVHQRW